MGFLELLTVILIIGKLTGLIGISWFGAFLPIIVSFSLYALFIILLAVITIFK